MAKVFTKSQFSRDGQLIFGLEVRGQAEEFPLVVGCSIRTEAGHIIDLPARRLRVPGPVLWVSDAPAECAFLKQDGMNSDGWAGQIIFALWSDATFTNRLHDTGWVEWLLVTSADGNIAEREATDRAIRAIYGTHRSILESLEGEPQGALMLEEPNLTELAPKKAQVFIGSSREGLSIAYAIQTNLINDADTTVWEQEQFALGGSTLENLVDGLDNYDFGIFVLSPDDIVNVRGQQRLAARDSVLFELGMYIGRLGRQRSFFVTPSDRSNFHLPSDLEGITFVTFDQRRIPDHAVAALGPACSRIRTAIHSLGMLRRKGPSGSYLDIDYGIKITSPGEGDTIGQWTKVTGSYSLLPPPDTLRLFTVGSVKTANGERLWPQEVVRHFSPDTKTWSSHIHIGGPGPAPWGIVAAVTGPTAIILCNFYFKVGPQIGWWEIEGWPPDAVIAHRIGVRRNNESD